MREQSVTRGRISEGLDLPEVRRACSPKAKAPLSPQWEVLELLEGAPEGGLTLQDIAGWRRAVPGGAALLGGACWPKAIMSLPGPIGPSRLSPLRGPARAFEELCGAWRRALPAPTAHASPSEKTEVYISARRGSLKAGGPRAWCRDALTPQTVDASGRFGESIAVLHSRLAPGAFSTNWGRHPHRRVDVVIGARSGCRALEGLGLIVVDEEHEPPTSEHHRPNHAAEVAQGAASSRAAPCAGATPSMQTYFRAMAGPLGLLECRSGWRGLRCPGWKSRNAQQVLQGTTAIFRALARAPGGLLARGEQAIRS